MTTEKTNDPKAFAELVKKLGAQLTASYAPEELREVWRRLPNVIASPPKAAKALAERVALYVLELGDAAPVDLREFVAGTEPLRDFGPLTKSTAAEEQDGATEAPAQEGAKNEAAADAAGPPTDDTKEDTTMHTQESAGRKGRKAAAPAAPKPKGKKAAKKAAAPRNTDGKKAAAKAPADRPPRGSGPREGTICAMVIQLTKDGKSAEQVAKQVAKAFPGTEFQKKADKGDNSLVAWYRNYARNKGWLPTNSD